MADEDTTIEPSADSAEAEPEETPKRAKKPVGAARPNDLPIVVHEPALANSTLASRAEKRASRNKRVESSDADIETK